MATRGKKEKEYPPMPANWMYKRGDVYMMDLNPYSGSEQGGVRPAIVVQNDDGNFYSNVLLVVPLTTQIKKRNMPTHFVLHNRFLSAPSMATSVSVSAIQLWVHWIQVIPKIPYGSSAGGCSRRCKRAALPAVSESSGAEQSAPCSRQAHKRRST